MAPHMVDGMARHIAGAVRLSMSIQMSLASVVAHTMRLQLSGFAQRPFLYRGCTGFAQSSGTSVFPMAMSHRLPPSASQVQWEWASAVGFGW